MNNENSSEVKMSIKKKLSNFQHHVKKKLDSFNQLNSAKNSELSFPNSHLHIPGKINFHELLSMQLQKQIQKENSLKFNQTFCLKFQSEAPTKQKHPSKQHFNRLNAKSPRIYTGSILSAEKTSNKRKEPSDINIPEESMKQASRTLYFKPIGKIARDYYKENTERKSLQLSRIKIVTKDKQNHKFEVMNNGYRDKLLMLLQIRKQEKIQKQKAKLNFTYANGFNSFRKMSQKDKQLEDEKYEMKRSSSFRESQSKFYQESSPLLRNKKGHIIKLKKEDNSNPEKLSPWYQVDNVEDI